MKKFISVILLISFMLLTLIGCSNTETPTNTPDDTTGGDNSSTPAFTDSIKDYDTVDDSSTEGFVIKSKKYDYEENNVILLNVENQTDNNYTVTVDMTYYDDGGNEITKESQSFQGFAANWQKYFAFDPGIPFSSYDYTVTTEEYSGECYAQYVEISFGKLEKTKGYSSERIEKYDDYTKFPGVCAICYKKNSSGYNLTGGYYLIVIDNTGEIFSIRSSGITVEPYAKGDGYNNLTLVQFLEGELIWPEELKGDVLGIVVLGNISRLE